MSKADILWRGTIFMSLDEACGVLKCGFPELDDHIKAGRLRVSSLPIHRQHGRLRRVFTEDVAALVQAQDWAGAVTLEPNRTLGSHPGCGACLRLCAVCRKIQNRCTSSLINEYEAYEILGFTPKGGLIAFLRKHKVFIDTRRKNHRISFADVAEIKRQLILQSIDVDRVRREIVDALDQIIGLRRQEMAELDAELIRYSVGHEQPPFRYGRIVDQTEPPVGLWYVYHLCYSNGRPFYVGKGVGNRMYQHEKEAIQGKGSNTYKCGVIRKILAKSERICYRVVFVTPEESEAYEYEIQEIARIGYKKLTNLTLGGASREEYDRVFGSQVPNEQRSYSQFVRLLDLHPSLSKEDRNRLLRNWADIRIYRLQGLHSRAVGLKHSEAIQKIDAETEALRGLASRQLSFLDLEQGRHRRYSEWNPDYY